MNTSPTPWTIDREAGLVTDAQGDLVALIDGISRENAALLVGAVAMTRNLQPVLDRRVILVDRKFKIGLDERDADELAGLQDAFGLYQDAISPLPTEGLDADGLRID